MDKVINLCIQYLHCHIIQASQCDMLFISLMNREMSNVIPQLLFYVFLVSAQNQQSIGSIIGSMNMAS